MQNTWMISSGPGLDHLKGARRSVLLIAETTKKTERSTRDWRVLKVGGLDWSLDMCDNG